jgi:thiosulfate reductase cytochrome b subunit
MTAVHTVAQVPPLHPTIVRMTHWINAVAIVILTLSGWQIHNAHPILPFTIPNAMTLGGWLAGALLWHFAAMWLLVANFLVLAVYGLLSGRYRRRLWPIRPREIVADLRDALTGRLGHDPAGDYNAVQKLLYAGVLGLIILVIASGLAIWKPVQLQGLTMLFGGFQGARLVHFLAMAGIVAFAVVHVAMALLVPRTLRAMILGR